jgi:hypothetical protein
MTFPYVSIDNVSQVVGIVASPLLPIPGLIRGVIELSGQQFGHEAQASVTNHRQFIQTGFV